MFSKYFISGAIQAFEKPSAHPGWSARHAHGLFIVMHIGQGLCTIEHGRTEWGRAIVFGQRGDECFERLGILYF